MPRPMRHPARPRLESLETRQLLATFVVTNTGDSGAGSLRQAILDANADAATGTATYPERINFAIPGAGTPTIAPTSPLPTMLKATTIDATTQGGSASTIGVILDGVNAVSADGSPVDGLDFGTDGKAEAGLIGGGASGLEIIRFSGSAIVNSGPVRDFSDLALGSDLSGRPDLGNGGHGIKLASFFGGGTVADTVIAHNGFRGIGGPNDSPTGNIFSTYRATNVTQFDNERRGTVLTVSTPAGESDDGFVKYGSTQTLTFTVTNTGSNPATNVVPQLTHGYLSNFAALQSVTTTQGTVTWDGNPDINASRLVNFGTIAPGASATVTLVVQVTDEAQTDPSGNPSNTSSDIFNVGVHSPEFDYDPFSTRAYYTLTATPDGQAPTAPPPPLYPGPIVYYPPTSTGTTGTGTDTNPLPPVAIVPVETIPLAAAPDPITVLDPQPVLVAPDLAPDLKVTSVAPTTAVVAGQPTTLTFDVTNSGGNSLETNVLIDLSALPTGSTFTIGRSNANPEYVLLLEVNGSDFGAATPVAGHPGLYSLSLGSILAGASASVSVVVTPTTGANLVVSAEAQDLGDPTGDPTPSNNVALAIAPIATPTASGTAVVVSPSTVRVDLATVLPRAQVQKLSHYQLTTDSGTTVRLRSANYNHRSHKVTLRLAHPLPVGTTMAHLAINGLGSDADIALAFTRKGRRR